MFKVEVIIPVFNNKIYINKAIESANILEEVHSIIVIDDGSTDGTYELLLLLKEKYQKLIVLTHPNRINMGIASSRNLGIIFSTSKWIAFLDSDDYYLADRFHYVRQLVASNSNIEGVYEPVVNKILSNKGAKRFNTNINDFDNSIIMIRPEKGESPFQAQFFGRGVVHLNGLTIQRQLAIRVGLFDEKLKIVDDSVFRLKVSFLGNLVAGSQKPVAVRTIHDTNNEPNISSHDLFLKHKIFYEFLVDNNASHNIIRIAIKKTIYSFLNKKTYKRFDMKILGTAILFILNPRILISYFVKNGNIKY